MALHDATIPRAPANVERSFNAKTVHALELPLTKAGAGPERTPRIAWPALEVFRFSFASRFLS